METFKATVRYAVLAFVMVAAVITLAGPDNKIMGSKSTSADKQNQSKDYAQSKQDLLNAETG